ncbi:MAG: AAA family ATPase [Burkholderiaceae bacterium]
MEDIMIVDFTIENFRSIKTEQIFSMYVQNPKKHLSSNVAFPADDKVGVVRSAGIYGANASGKSNFLLAFRALRYIACSSGNLKDGQKIPCYEPFLLSQETENAPIRFEIEFVNTDKRRYRYAVSFNQYEIIDEVLDFFPSRAKANLFKRLEGNTWENISFGGLYKGGTRRIPFFKNNSYLSKAGNNAGASKMIRSVYDYLWNNLGQQIAFEDAFGPLYKDEKILELASKFLCNVDTGIHAVEVKENNTPLPDLFSNQVPEKIKNLILERSKKAYFFSHKMENGNVAQFKHEEESEGTQRLFSMLPFLISTFKNGSVFIVDEIDSSFHPHIAELIIKLFNDAEINVNNAQLIFSTHSISLMSSKDMRRDQIWFVEKKEGKSGLYCLDDFDKDTVKSDSPFGTWYNDGRFGALPSIDYEAIAEILKSGNSISSNPLIELEE